MPAVIVFVQKATVRPRARWDRVPAHIGEQFVNTFIVVTHPTGHFHNDSVTWSTAIQEDVCLYGSWSSNENTKLAR